ncbi:PIN domain-containing protein [Geoalkalibacter subterraneus]|jgi:predicted nucleic acid-binding protein|uniref:Twitching motility protein PilT n=1 Tax=Geoalkalibacter subterraneus TaxID=483547 RepID=A0A0B5FD91_9BACT|nr:PIN domain-containing protein [Geoalkalibacter subterraneus]AJF06102.1 twitching motility protein PilT [Geoalkalibacter subterraneus]
MRVALDTNVLAYAEGLGDQSRCARAMELVERLPLGEVIIPAQTLGELSRVLRSKAKRSAEDTRSAVLSWADTFSVADSTWPAFQAALDLNVDHKLQIWDALILAVAAEQHCRILLTEDMHAGFTWRGVTLVNPFAPEIDPLLEQLLA